ncbi:MAG: BamA/TamA family outer membrane protein [Vicingaceae bacterium]
MAYFRFLVFISALICCFNSQLSAQKIGLEINYDTDATWLKRMNVKEEFKDSLALRAELSSLILALQKRSYFGASVDSLVKTDKKVTAYVHLGDQLDWARLKRGNIEEEVLSKTGYRDKIYNQYRFRYRQFGRFVEGILAYYENNGYPFVSLRLDSIRNINERGIDAVLHLEKKKYTEIDTVEIYGGDFVSEKYLYNYLDIKPHKPYNEANVKAISGRIDDLNFIGRQQEPRVIFTETETRIQLFLIKKRASRFDGIIGVLQNEEDGSVQLTGDVKLGLTNSFKRGEVIGLNWRGLPNNTQDLNIRFKYPYLLNTPFGIDVDFRLYKRDTTFLDIVAAFGLPYYINARDYLEVSYENHASNLLSTSQYEAAGVLPPVLDFQTDYYGVELSLNKVDYILNPTRGYYMTIGGKAGFKTVEKNANLADSLYDEVELKTVVFKGQLRLGYFIPLAARHVLLFANKSGYLQIPQVLDNEMFRIGGLNILRGFNEESIFVSAYSIGTVEYRFILEKSSNINIFADLAYTEREGINTEKLIDRPFAIGAGTSFETGAGIFSLSYALGSQRGNPLDLRAAKIHFGFLNYF